MVISRVTCIRPLDRTELLDFDLIRCRRRPVRVDNGYCGQREHVRGNHLGCSPSARYDHIKELSRPL